MRKKFKSINTLYREIKLFPNTNWKIPTPEIGWFSNTLFYGIWKILFFNIFSKTFSSFRGFYVIVQSIP